jgi:hypothetical protein
MSSDTNSDLFVQFINLRVFLTALFHEEGVLLEKISHCEFIVSVMIIIAY